MKSKTLFYSNVVLFLLVTVLVSTWNCSDGSSLITGPVIVTNGYAISIEGENISLNRTDMLTFTVDTSVVNLTILNFRKGSGQIEVRNSDGTAIFSHNTNASITLSDTLLGLIPASVSILLDDFSGDFSFNIKEK